jgi:hypothetical protein
MSIIAHLFFEIYASGSSDLIHYLIKIIDFRQNFKILKIASLCCNYEKYTLPNNKTPPPIPRSRVFSSIQSLATGFLMLADKLKRAASQQ